MLRLEGKLEIKVLKEQGLSIRKIAKKLRVSRNTVRRALREEGVVRYTRPGVVCKLDPYKNYLLMKIGEADFTSTRLYREIKELGYKGSYTLVKEFLREYRIKREKEATVRFETVPGQQGQVDWSDFGSVEFSDYKEKKHVSCFCMVLGFSRCMNNEYYFCQSLENFIDAHIKSFEYFGGVPKEILYDRVKSVVLESYTDSEVKWNEKFLDFARFYGFKPLLCRPYWPRTKGKVERPYGYIEEDFFLGRTFKNLDDLNNQGREWLDKTANLRIHGTTREVPLVRLEHERKYLIPLPERRYEFYEEVLRRSAKDCYISYGGNRYSVPWKYVKKDLRVLVKAGEIFIYQGEEKICSHRVSKGKGELISNLEHFKGIVKSPTSVDLQKIYGEFNYLGGGCKEYLAGLKEAKVDHLTWQVKKVLELVTIYGKEEVLGAIERALKYKAFGYSYIRNICRGRGQMEPGMSSVREILAVVFKKYGVPQVETRPLAVYSEEGGEKDEQYNLPGIAG